MSLIMVFTTHSDRFLLVALSHTNVPIENYARNESYLVYQVNTIRIQIESYSFFVTASVKLTHYLLSPTLLHYHCILLYYHYKKMLYNNY